MNLGSEEVKNIFEIYLEQRHILSVDHDVDHGIVGQGGQKPSQDHKEQEEVEYPKSTATSMSISSTPTNPGVETDRQEPLTGSSFHCFLIELVHELLLHVILTKYFLM